MFDNSSCGGSSGSWCFLLLRFLFFCLLVIDDGCTVDDLVEMIDDCDEDIEASTNIVSRKEDAMSDRQSLLIVPGLVMVIVNVRGEEWRSGGGDEEEGFVLCLCLCTRHGLLEQERRHVKVQHTRWDLLRMHRHCSCTILFSWVRNKSSKS